uniref:ABC transporter ATP-binding protein n=1 Tax=Desulfomonile tiedjei TaxID=2358 RepID=A0A7C4ETJ8_9BACT
MISSDDTSVVYAAHLSKKFGQREAVNDLTFNVARGELFGLVGPDGAGKTTTIRMLAGILEPSDGDALIDGISVRDQPEAIKEHIAYMPQRFGLYQDLTVMENLTFYADLFGVPKKDRAPRIDQLLGFSRLTPFKTRLAGALSGGMKQKLGLACALIHSPRLLLLDEPTNGVDPVSRRDFWKILYELLKQGISILVSTAYLDEAERTARVALLHQGRIIRLGTPEQLKQLVKGHMVEIVSENVRDIKQLVSVMAGVIDVNVFGDALHVRFRSSEDAQQTRDALQASGLNIVSMKSISPAIEDVFLSLIPRSGDGASRGEPM